MGKRTTTRHKEDNTFKFQTFEEKLKNITVNVNLSIRDGRGELPEDDTTFFCQEVEKWVDLNRTESFGELIVKIGTDIKSLAQVLLQKSRLADLLLKHLENFENLLSFEPTFALAVALSRDLGAEFYPYFPKFFKTIVDIVISSRKPEIIEHGFRCYAYLSKYLRRQIIKDIPEHMALFAPLLNSKLKAYVVIFACEAFEGVVSKYAKEHGDKFLDLVCKVLLKNQLENAYGVATLFFAMLKRTGGSLKVGGPECLLTRCLHYAFKIQEISRDTWIQMLTNLIEKLLFHAKSTDLKQIFEIFEATLIDPKYREQSPIILQVYKQMVEFDSCNKVPDLNKCILVLKIIFKIVSSREEHFEILCDLIIALIHNKGKSSNPEIFISLKPTVISLLENAKLPCVKKIDHMLQDTSHYFHSYLIPITNAYERNEEDSSRKLIVSRCISNAVVRQQGFYYCAKKLPHLFTGMSSVSWFYENQKTLIRPFNLGGILSKTYFNCCDIMSEALDSLAHESNIEKLVRIFLSYSRIFISECKTCVEKTNEIVNHVIDYLELCDDKSKFTMLLLYIFESLIVHGSMDGLNTFGNINLSKLLLFIENTACGAANASSQFSIWSLKCLDVIVHQAKISADSLQKDEVKKFLCSMKCKLASNLQCGFKIVRTITLSILLNTMQIESENVELKKQELLTKLIEIEDTNVLDPKFSPLVKSTLTEMKVMMESSSTTQTLRKLCLQYTLGLMYSNFNLIWPACVELIQLSGKNIQIEEFWKIFSVQFRIHFPESLVGAPRLEIFPKDDDKNDFLNQIQNLTFGFPLQTNGLFENLDIAQYRVNLWKAMVNQPVRKQEYQSIFYIIDKTITGSFHYQKDERNVNDEITRTLIPLFQFLEKCELTNVDSQLWEKSLKHLTSTPDVQKVVWEFLHAKRKKKLSGIKEDIDDLIKSDSMDCYHKFRIDAVDTSMNKQYQNESLEKRSMTMDIVLRILIGKERKWKAEKRLQTLRFIGGCSADDAKKYLNLTIGSDLRDLRISPKALEVKINKIANCIRAWRYKFPTILDELLDLVCDLADAIKNLQKPFPKYEDEELPDSVFEEQKKGAMKAARLCLLAFFTFLPKFNLDEKLIDKIFNIFIWKGIEEMKSHSGSSESWIMKLFHVWSTHERFHVLFAKCSTSGIIMSPMQAVFDSLASSSVHFDVKKYFIWILFNLIEIAKPESNPYEDDSYSLEHSEKFDAKPLHCTEIFKFENSGTEKIGLNVVLYGKQVLLKLFENVSFFKKLVGQSGGEKCLILISRLAEHVIDEDQDSVEKLCEIIIETLPLYKHSEEDLFNCLLACKNLLSKVDDPSVVLRKLAAPFMWITGRRLRSALCDILISLKGSFLGEVIRDMNAWSDSAVDTPDFSKRQSAFQKLEDFIQGEAFDSVTFTFVTMNCFHNLLQESDIGMKNASKSLMIAISQCLSTKPSHSLEIRQFLEYTILPRLRGGIHHKDDGRFADFLQVYIAFIKNCSSLHGTFKELDKILSVEIIEGLYDIQMHLRTRAMNRLCKKITEVGKDISPMVLKNFVLPLANHNLLDEDKLGSNRSDLIHSSIETLKAILFLFPADYYFKYLISLIKTSKKKTNLAKQYERILVAVMDAYHFDLRLATDQDKEIVSSVEINLEKEESEVTTCNEEVRNQENVDFNSESEDDHELQQSEREPQTEATLIPKATAIKYLRLLKTVIVPKLRQYLNFEEKVTHKFSRAEKKVDSDVILKIPCTLALVKLLKKLPKAEGEVSIRSIIPILCAGLRNELFSTRHSLRKTILSVTKELGISHFRSVISYLKATLQRGYQRHVLAYTIGYLMKCLEPELRSNPEYLPIKEVLPLCEEELYGVMQEEKELAAIKAKTKEAGKNNAYPILQLCAKCIQNNSHLSLLVEPAMKNLATKRSPKIVKTTRQWLNSISDGLADNLVIDHIALMQWLKEVIDKERENISGCEPEVKKRKLLVEPKDAFILPVASTKTRIIADGKITGQFLLTEFAFGCLYNGLNKNTRLKDSLFKSNEIQVLDKFVQPLSDGIQSGSKQVNIVALRSLTLLFEFDLKSFRNDEVIDGLRRSGFIAMNNHCYRTSTDTQMSNATFKFLAAFFTRFPEYKIVVQDFELMLKCIQSYLTNEECSSAAITLLKGVLRNKYKSIHLQDLMEEVFKQGIQSLYQHINEGCRQAYSMYLNNYCTSPNELAGQVRLILNQFDYTVANGRLTAVEIMNTLLESMPEICLEEVKELVFLKTLACLDKEDQKSVRSKLGDVMKTLFKSERKKSLVRLLLKLMNSNNHISELDTFFLVAGVLIEDPNIFTVKEFGQLLSKIEEVLNPESFERLCGLDKSITMQAQDYAIYQALICLKKGLDRKVEKLNIWDRKCSFSATVKAIFQHLRDSHLLHEHVWVPPVALDILFHVLDKFQLDEDKMVRQLESSGSPGNIVFESIEDLLTFSKNVWTILKTTNESQTDVVEKGAVVLSHLGCIAARFSNLATLEGIIANVRRSVNHEVVKDPKNTKVRCIAFKIFRGIVNGSPTNAITAISEPLTRVCVRELTDEGIPGDLKVEAEKLTSILRSALGNGEFNLLYARINDFYHKKRNINRAKKKETFVLHPGKVRKRPQKQPREGKMIPFKKSKKNHKQGSNF